MFSAQWRRCLFSRPSSVGFRHLSSSRCSVDALTNSEEMDASLLRHCRLSMPCAGESVELDVVYVDSASERPVKTVLALHGSPGSHRDFKRLLEPLQQRNIRFLALNWPGHGFTPSDDRFVPTTSARTALLRRFLDEMGVRRVDVLLTHSAGSAPALSFATEQPERCGALLLTNPIGLRPHNAIRPYWWPCLMADMWMTGWFTRLFLRPFFYIAFRYVYRLPIRSGETAAATTLTVRNVDFASMGQLVKQFANKFSGRVVAVLGHKDWLIEPAVSDEFLTTIDVGEEQRTSLSVNDFDKAELSRRLSSGDKRIALSFDEGDHFLPIRNPTLIVELIDSILLN